MDERIWQNALVYTTVREPSGYNVFYHNGVSMGTLEVDVDGYYKYWPVQRAGYWESSSMRAIADLLDHVNKLWDEQRQKMITFKEFYLNEKKMMMA